MKNTGLFGVSLVYWPQTNIFDFLFLVFLCPYNRFVLYSKPNNAGDQILTFPNPTFVNSSFPLFLEATLEVFKKVLPFFPPLFTVFKKGS